MPSDLVLFEMSAFIVANKDQISWSQRAMCMHRRCRQLYDTEQRNSAKCLLFTVLSSLLFLVRQLLWTYRKKNWCPAPRFAAWTITSIDTSNFPKFFLYKVGYFVGPTAQFSRPVEHLRVRIAIDIVSSNILSILGPSKKGWHRHWKGFRLVF